MKGKLSGKESSQETVDMNILWQYFRFIKAIGCLIYSQIAVANVTLQKAVLSTEQIFSECTPKHASLQ